LNSLRAAVSCRDWCIECFGGDEDAIARIGGRQFDSGLPRQLTMLRRNLQAISMANGKCWCGAATVRRGCFLNHYLQLRSSS